ncbi:hypothetical protein [Nereida sp. MMG025]|uniref:hypothetical protein n=1 Tax=Nereida sp. MMG025 TaxID=2909981 RepID=UPI001F33CA81|nr:hypothetical protein [Nereida sp. MMG025]MCF6446181.1 hypothetical protein [Nereida sp. MMG025]
MIFVTADGLSLDYFVDWLNQQTDADNPRARIIVKNVVVDQRVEISAQPDPGRFLLQADRLEDELLVAREMSLFLQSAVHVYVIEDETYLRLVMSAPTGNDVHVSQDLDMFIQAAFTVLGRSQLEEPDDFIHDQLLDWAVQWLQSRGHKNHLGFASFDRHRLIVHAQRRSSYLALPSALSGELGVENNRPHAIGLAHPKFAASLEQKESLEDGTQTYMGFVYFFDQPEWREISSADIALQKLNNLMRLCQPETPWIASDIQNRTVGLTEEGGAWIDMWEWLETKAVLSREFYSLPDDI